MEDQRRIRWDQRTVEVSDHLCECGCGQFTMVAPRTYRARGIVKGQPRRFVFGHQIDLARASVPPRKPRFRLRIVKVKVRPRPWCACGCGVKVERPGRRFVQGHRLPWKSVRWVAEDRGYETPCWIWQLGVDVHGYGKLTRRGVRLKAHRVAYEDAGGVIPAGYELHHRCEQKQCVNPDHLRPLTPEQHGQLHGEAWRRAA